MAWGLRSITEASLGGVGGTLGRGVQAPSLKAGTIATLIDEGLSRKILASRVDLERLLLDGVPAGEGEARVEDVARMVAEKSRSLAHGVVLAVVYTTGGEVWILGHKGRVAVGVDGPRKLYGHEALNLYRDARGEYVIVLGRPSL